MELNKRQEIMYHEILQIIDNNYEDKQSLNNRIFDYVNKLQNKLVKCEATLNVIHKVINNPWLLTDYETGKEIHRYKSEMLDITREAIREIVEE